MTSRYSSSIAGGSRSLSGSLTARSSARSGTLFTLSGCGDEGRGVEDDDQA